MRNLFISLLCAIALAACSEGDPIMSYVQLDPDQVKSQHHFGDGSDGDVTISAPTSLTRDMFYSNLVVNDMLDPAGFKIWFTGTLSGTGKIRRNGAAGADAVLDAPGFSYVTIQDGSICGNDGYLYTAGSGGAGGVDGQNGNAGGTPNAVNAVLNSIGDAGQNSGVGGNGGDTGGFTGGIGDTDVTGGTVTVPAANSGGVRDLIYFTLWRTFPAGGYPVMIRWAGNPRPGCGGGGGAAEAPGDMGGNGGAGGGGGEPGGAIYLAGRIIDFSGGLDIESIGGAGGLGGNGTDGAGSDAGGGGAGGGGAGGNGGIIVIAVNQILGTASVSVAGGVGGGPGTFGLGIGTGQDGNPSNAGLDGLAGEIIYFLCP